MGIYKKRSKTQLGVMGYKDFPPSFFNSGYTRLIDNPEFRAGIDKIADLVSNMTIMLMENTDSGAKRLENALSRKLDISPNKHTTRKTFIYHTVYNLLIHGNQVILPVYRKGELEELIPIKESQIQFWANDYSYEIHIDNIPKRYDEVLHFRINPSIECPFVGEGYRVQLKDVVDNLKQALATKKAFMGSRYMPPIVIGVDSHSEKIKSKAGREELLTEYVETEKGKPWIIPSSSMDIKQVKPLTLKDIAINESVEIDKKTVAMVLGIPAYLLGVGEYNEDEYNNFVATKILSIAEILQQEFTSKLIVNNNQFFRFNIRSLYRYSIVKLSEVSRNLKASGIIDGNEARNWIGFDSREGLDELSILENYIPVDKIGKQNKLKDGEKDETE